MAGTNDILEVAKMTINASIKCNTVRGFIGWHSCDNICMDMLLLVNGRPGICLR